MKKYNSIKEILVIIAVLTGIAVVSGLLLGVMNKFTYVDETEALIEDIEKIYESPISEQINITDYENIEDTEILNAFIAENGAYIINSKSEKAYSSEGLKLLVIIKDGEIVASDGKGNDETPGLGTKALSEDYLENYEGISYDYFSDEEEDGESNNSGDGIEFDWSLSIDINSETGDTSGATSINEGSDRIDAISGATKSSVGVEYAIKAALKFYETMEGNNEQ